MASHAVLTRSCFHTRMRSINPRARFCRHGSSGTGVDSTGAIIATSVALSTRPLEEDNMVGGSDISSLGKKCVSKLEIGHGGFRRRTGCKDGGVVRELGAGMVQDGQGLLDAVSLSHELGIKVPQVRLRRQGFHSLAHMTGGVIGPSGVAQYLAETQPGAAVRTVGRDLLLQKLHGGSGGVERGGARGGRRAR